MEGSCSTGQRPQWAVVPVEEEEVEPLEVGTKFLVRTLTSVGTTKGSAGFVLFFFQTPNFSAN
jgi:hypothetical protein